MRDIIVYKCDVCDREVQLHRKPKTIETAGRCIITAQCRGKLYVERLIKTTSPFVKRTEEVVGLDNFYPRAKLFKFTQRFDKATWVITHNLESFPIISVYDDDKNVIPDSEFTLKLIDKNTVTLTFTVSRSGTAELYVREVSVIETVAAVSTDIETTPVSSNSLLGTMAILTTKPRGVLEQVFDGNLDPVLDEEGQPTYTTPTDTLRFKITSAAGQIQYSSAFVNATNTGSPWTGYETVIIRNKTYYLGFVDFFSNGFNQSLISNGTIIEVDSIVSPNDDELNLLEVKQSVSHFLLAESPFDRADIIRDRILENSKVNSTTGSLFFDNDEVFCNNTFITKLYPKLITT